MKNTSQNFVSKTLLALATFACIGSANAYDFTVTNSTEVKIVSIEVTEDGESWGPFDIGAGLAAGASTKITWAAHTDDSGCEWQVRAGYADGSESEPAEFDFCEEDLEIEFTE